MTTIAVERLGKSYGAGTLPALAEVSFEVGAGELFGLIGPDGAGKTTLLRILTTLLLADRGRATVLGLDVVRDFRALRPLIGYMPGHFSLYQDLSVEENLKFFATVFGTTVASNYARVSEIYAQLEPVKSRPAGKLSGGMKQKLALCCALIHAPRVLFLDEPTTGVDPVSRRDFWAILGRIRQSGVTIVVSTPYMDEATRCDRVALIKDGRFIALDSVPGLLAQHGTPTYAVRGADRARLLRDLRRFPGTSHCFAFGQEHHLVFRSDAAGPPEVEAYLRGQGHQAVSIRSVEPSIEDVYISLTRESSRV